MFEVLLVLLAVSSVGARRYNGVSNRRGLKSLLQSLDKDVYATCDIVFFAEPKKYDDAVRSCKEFRLGGGKKGDRNLATVDSMERSGQLTLLHDMAYPLADQMKKIPDDTKWAWIGLRKVKNNHKKYKPNRMKRKKNVLKEYNVEDWKWMSNGKSPTDYDKWSRRRNDARPDQVWLGRIKGRNMGCHTMGGCFQNQVRVNQKTTFWDDSWDFVAHPYACDYKGKYILSGLFLTWNDAVKACRRAGLSLATVRSKEDVKQMKQAIEFFLGEGDDSWTVWDSKNWVWLGGSDRNAEGNWRWLNGDPVQSWNVPWRKKSGNDNADYLRGANGQHALAFSRWGEFDDSFHDHKKRKRNFACECPGL